MRISRQDRKYGRIVQTYKGTVNLELNPDEQFVVFNSLLKEKDLLEVEMLDWTPKQKQEYYPYAVIRQLIRKIESLKVVGENDGGT